MISPKLKLESVPGLTFNDEEGKHQHLYNGTDEWPGCTNVSGLYSPDGWKFAWPVKLMKEHLLESFKRGCRLVDGLYKGMFMLDDDTLEMLLNQAKNAWREKRDKSADSGTRSHSLIEAYIKTDIMEPFLEDPEVLNSTQQFMNWESKTKPEWLASEVQVGSRTHKFAGILDSLALIEDKTVLIDFKTSSSIKDDYNIQLAGLCICLEEMGLKVDQRAILHLPKKGEYEYRIIDTDLEFEKKCFLAGLEHYKLKTRFLKKHD